MKLYIAADMEGITGIVHSEQLDKSGSEYEAARKLLTGDVNAAVEGALEGGATEILVNDCHSTMRNIIFEELNENARLIVGIGRDKPLCQVEGADETFDAAFLIGFHGRAGNERCVHPHTLMGGIVHKYKINDTEVGEAQIAAAVLGEMGIPVVLAVGDSVFCKEIEETLDQVVTVAVKEPLGPQTAICLTPGKTRKLIKGSAREAVKLVGSARPVQLDTPCTVTLLLNAHQMARRADEMEFVERVGEREIKVRAPTVTEAVAQAWKALCHVSTPPAKWLQGLK